MIQATLDLADWTMDGDMTDWANVLSDPDNNSCDGATDNSGTTYEPQPDLDAPVQSTGRDLSHFAFSWDSSYVHAYTARSASSANVQRFIYYADTDNDGLMETGELVIVAQWKGSNRNVELFLGAYNEVTAGGDAMVDGSGYADGYSLPGTATGFPSVGQPDYSGTWGSSDGLSMEWRVPWSQFGISPGTAFTFHVSSTNSQPGSGSFPAQVDDNIGGCGGGAVSTQYAGVTLTADQTLSGDAGTTIYAAHMVTNTGNGNDVFDLTAVVTGGTSPPTAIVFYNDADGSGTYTAGDAALTDTDSSGSVDTGTLSASGVKNILVAYTLPAVSSGSSTVTLTATSAYNAIISDTDVDTITAIFPDLVVLKSVSTIYDPTNAGTNPKAIPGAHIEYTIQVSNTGTATAENVFITDNLNTEITAGTISFRTDTYAPGRGIQVTAPDINGGAAQALTNALDADEGDFNGTTSNTVTVNAGNLDANESAIIKLQVVVQ